VQIIRLEPDIPETVKVRVSQDAERRKEMARFRIILGNGGELELDAGAVDNVPEFVGELKKNGYVTGRRENGKAIALIDPHVATVELIG
jgi:hypothetical protein